MSDSSSINPDNKTSYLRALEYLYDRLPVFHHIGSEAYKPGLGNTQRLMNSLGNPQNSYRTIHVAGTNGKGSVSHMLAAVLQEAGYKVGLYTSPHLIEFGERIRVNGKMIGEQYVINFVEQNKLLFNEVEPSFFEATMAMAFAYFEYAQVDIAVIEVGLGGRLDSTNILNPVLSIITNISYDHVGFLGDTLERIAFEKAGIIKSRTPVVIGETQSVTRPVFEQKSKEQHAPIYFAEEFTHVSFIENAGSKMKVSIAGNVELKIGLSGNYQLKNVGTAFAAITLLRKLGFEIPDHAVYSGFENVNEITGFRGRWQNVRESPKIIADTGHNVAGIEFVVQQLKNQDFNTLHFVIGMVNDKDISSILALLPKNAHYYFTRAEIPRALPSHELMQKAETFSLNGEAYNSVKEAVTAAIKNAGQDDLIFIGGSTFVVGEALAILT